MTNPLPGENKFGTSPVRSSYWGFMSVDLQADLEAVSSFISSANYPNPMNALEAEWGSTRNVRWLLNTNGFQRCFANVYSSFILGKKPMALFVSALKKLSSSLNHSARLVQRTH